MDSVSRLRSCVTQALANKAWKTVDDLLGESRWCSENGHQTKISNPPKVRLEAARLVIEYRYGKPVSPIEFNVQEKAKRLAERYGIPEAELLAAAQRIVTEDELN